MAVDALIRSKMRGGFHQVLGQGCDRLRADRMRYDIRRSANVCTPRRVPAMPAGPIPVNLVTGFLGVGKTTAIVDLLKRKNPAEKWAVLVNEYGDVSVDEAFLESSVVWINLGARLEYR